MNRPFAPLALVLVLGACASRATTPAATPASAPTPASATPAPAAAAPAPAPATTSAPIPTPTAPAANWQLLDLQGDQVLGTGVARAKRELLATRTPARTVLVAVIDGGIDTLHASLKNVLWRNPREVAGNGKDDDGNGYVDDVFGWNFIGGKAGSVNKETLELTRVHAACTAATGGSSAPVSRDSALGLSCAKVAEQYEAKKQEAQQQLAQITQIETVVNRVMRTLKHALGDSAVTPARVQALRPTIDSVRIARDIYGRMMASGITAEKIAEAKEDAQGTLDVGLSTAFDARKIVGDDPTNVSDRHYGNRDVMGPDAKHGTHVSGIIAATLGDSGMVGIASSVKIMMVRTIPDGDERDKDVANAIRYAVDNGAQVINMSFGKGFSPQKKAVDEAVKYADSKGVLMVHAAGNDGENLAESPSFPVASYVEGGRAANWIEVGASSWKGGSDLAAPFSNYGQKEVDLFAPGVDILSTVPGGGFERESGTSMASPVVTGVAALLMSYFPRLTAADVKKILLDTSTKVGDQLVVRPGSQGEKVRFGTLSATGGVVNAYAAIKAAIAASGPAQ